VELSGIGESRRKLKEEVGGRRELGERGAGIRKKLDD
jgi:hypothetical protein